MGGVRLDGTIIGFGLVSKDASIVRWWNSSGFGAESYEWLGLDWYLEELKWKEIPQQELYKLIISSGVDMGEFNAFKEKYTRV